MNTERQRKRMQPYSTRRWHRLREAVRKRDAMTCQRCGQFGGKMEVDHIVPVSLGGEFWDIDGLQLLCRRCHYAKTVAERPQRATVTGQDGKIAEWRRFVLELR